MKLFKLLKESNTAQLKRQIQSLIKSNFSGRIQARLCYYGDTPNYLLGRKNGDGVEDDVPLIKVKDLTAEPLDGRIGYDFRIYKWNNSWGEWDLDENFYVVTDESGKILKASRNPIY